MKQSISTFVIMFFVASPGLIAATAEAQPQPAIQSGTITNVIVYRDRAQITRVGRANCARSEALFSGLPSTLDTRTLRGSMTGGEVIGVTWQPEVTGPRGRAKELQKQVRAINDKLSDLHKDRQRIGAVLSKLHGYGTHLQRVWGRQASKKRPPVKKWDSALDLLRKERKDAGAKRLAIDIKLRKLRRERRLLYQQNRRIARQSLRVTYRAKVLLRCQGTPQVALHYVVPGATWHVTYQARANTQTGRLEMIAQAIVKQGTGEDWRDVKLAVSTANLRRSNVPPSVRQMRVSTYEPRSKRMVLVRRYERRSHLKTKTARETTQKSGRRAGVRAKLAMQLTAAGKITVPSDGRGVVATLARVTRRADVAYETVPKLFPFVYKRVSLVNPFAFPMLRGPIALYRDGRFTGRTHTKRRAPGEPIKLSLGVENQLQVHRWVKEVKRYKPGTFGSSQRLVHRYLIQVGNWTRRRQVINVLENIPVSQVKDIRVAIGKKSTKPSKWNKEDGIARWKVVVPPRSKKKIVVEYTITVPKSWVVRGYALGN
jgi:uncharacterized protein (TIGR02231 family)